MVQVIQRISAALSDATVTSHRSPDGELLPTATVLPEFDWNPISTTAKGPKFRVIALLPPTGVAQRPQEVIIIMPRCVKRHEMTQPGSMYKQLIHTVHSA